MLKKLSYLSLLLFLAIGMATGVARAESYKEGVDYLRVAEQPTESADKVEVLEFFWYGCPHCYQFEPILEAWKKTMPAHVEFIRVPAVFRPEWKVHARSYYALQAMGLGEKYHSAIFDAIHKDKNDLYSEAAMTDFLASRGVAKDDFKAAYDSFSIDGKLRKAIQKVQGYGIKGVPAIGVNGKYLVSGSSAGSYENMLRIVDYLIKKEAAAKK